MKLFRPDDVAFEFATGQVSAAVREYVRKLEDTVKTLVGRVRSANKKKRLAQSQYQRILRYEIKKPE